MHRLTENYLSEIAAHLSPLPPKRRTEELREMRTHLENAVIVSREIGHSEDEAAHNAVAQFGTPQDLGENVVWAWRRGEQRDKRSFWGAVGSMPLMLTCLLLLQDHYLGLLLEHILPLWLNHYCVKHPDMDMALVQGVFLATFSLAGMVAGYLSPKRAVSAACLGLVAFWIGWATVMGLGYGGLWRFLSWVATNGWTLTAIVSAWVGSRARLTWMGRRRLARN